MDKIVRCGLMILLLAAGDVVVAGVVPEPRQIVPAGKHPVFEDEYFSDYHGNPCDFSQDGDFERIAGFGEGILDHKVENGNFVFRTAENGNYFFFGRWLYPKGDSTIPDENIGFGWPMYGNWRVKVRLKQSLAVSTWKIDYRVTRGALGNNPGRRGRLGKGLKIEGTDWQELDIGFATKGRALRALCFETLEPGNEISIDYVKIVNLRTPVCYRKTITLSADPVHARLRLNLPAEHFIYVNGKSAHYYHGYVLHDLNPVVDVTKFMVKGENTIAIGLRNCWHSSGGRKSKRIPFYGLICEGLALTEDGRFVSLNSDSEWRASFDYNDSWCGAAYDDSAWQRVDARGTRRLRAGPVTYVGPLYAEPGVDPIFRIADGIDLSLALPRGHTVSYSLVDALTDSPSSSGTLSVAPRNGALDHHTLSYKPAKPGVWHLSLDLLGNGEKDVDGGKKVVQTSLETRNLEVAVVGPIEQKIVTGKSATEGMVLTEIANIDCVNDSGFTRYSVGTSGGIFSTESKPKHSQVIDSPVGAYRESGDVGWSGFGYMFTVTNRFKPHLIEVEYPDDACREMMVKVFSSEKNAAVAAPARYRWNWTWEQRWYSGVITGGPEFPQSNTLRKLYLFYWPDGLQAANTVQILTQKSGLRAAASRIRICEIDDLPALSIPAGNDRIYGMFVEREAIVTRTFYPGTYYPRFRWYGTSYKDLMGRLRDWYVTTENLVKYMRFAGQNVYVPGYCMYSGIFFPESIGQSRSGGTRYPTDHFRLMAAMFEQNDLSLIIGAQYMTTGSTIEKAFPTNWEVKHQGKASVFGVHVDGQQSVKAGSAGSGAMDYENWWVDQDIRKMLSTFLRYSEQFKSVKGVLFYTAGMGFPSTPAIYMGGLSDSALSWGLDDAKISAFKDATGTDIPPGPGDPDRMLKRYNYLLTHPDILEKWNEFRCRCLHGQVVDLLDFVRKKRPDWQLYIAPCGPAPTERRAAVAGEMSYEDACRIRGYDLGLYTEPGIVNNMSGYIRHLRTMGRADAELKNAVRESFYYAGRWPTPAHTHAVVPAEPYAARDMVRAMVNFAPSTLVFGKADMVNISGGEHRLRDFVKAYRSLPAGDYKTLAGNGLDNNIVVRAAKHGKLTNFYVLNHHQYHVDVTLTCAPGATIQDLVTGDELPLIDNNAVCCFPLPPHSMRVFSSTTEIVSAATELCDAAKILVERQLALLKACRALAPAKMDLLLSKWRTGCERADILADIAGLESIYERGNHMRIVNISGMPELAGFLVNMGRYTALTAPPGAQACYRVNCATDSAYTDSNGNVWVADQSYLFRVDSFGFIGGDFKAVRGTIKIEGTPDPAIYQSERFRVNGYRFLVPAGRYTVRLHFAETFRPSRGMRVFNVVVEDKTLLADMDVFAEGGFKTALIKELPGIEVTDGELALDFSWSTANPVEINGIEVVRE